MVNVIYQQKVQELQESLQKKQDFPSVTLFDFFSSKTFNELTSKVKKLDFKKEKNPLTHSYNIAKLKFDNQELIKFISKVTKMKLSTLEFDVIQLKHRDYQILHDKYKRPKYEIIINITKDWDSLVGGNVFYVNGSGDYLELPGIGNVITITKTSILRHFIKYINFYADKDKRVLLLAKIF